MLMNKNLHFQLVARRLVSLIVAVCTATTVYAQSVYDGSAGDSLIINFSPANPYISDTNYFYIGHGSQDSLWQIGSTAKPFFSNGFTGRGMMTDTAQSYPANANCAFYIRTDSIYVFNFIVSFKHKYQTDSGKAGGMVEFSTDSGQTWHNVMEECMQTGQIRTENMYDAGDTLWTGEPAFMGNSAGWQYSRFQFFFGLPIRSTGGHDCLIPNPMLRFRFVSDTSSATLDGWLIDSIKLEADQYSSVNDIARSNALEVFPNPSQGGVFNFPALEKRKDYRVEVYDMTGRQLLDIPYTTRLDISGYSKDVYLYRVRSEDVVYTGQLLVQ